MPSEGGVETPLEVAPELVRFVRTEGARGSQVHGSLPAGMEDPGHAVQEGIMCGRRGRHRGDFFV